MSVRIVNVNFMEISFTVHFLIFKIVFFPKYWKKNYKNRDKLLLVKFIEDVIYGLSFYVKGPM